MKTIGESGKLSEDIYPQSLARTCMIHPPGFFFALFSVVKRLMPAKAMAKMGICPGRSAAHQSASACPFASARFDMAALPSFMGGTCRCIARGGCIACSPNDAVHPLAAANAAVAVGAGSSHEVALVARTPGDQLAWSFTIESGGLEVSAHVTPEVGPPLDLLVAKKYRSEDGPASGTVVVPVCGDVLLRFNNSHSRFKGKSVKINAVIMPAARAVKVEAAVPAPAEADVPAPVEAAAPAPVEAAVPAAVEA